MIWRYVKALVLPAFLVALMVFTGSVQKDVLKQKDPRVINFLAATYCPGIVRPDGSPPLTMMDTLIKGPGVDGRGGWEQLAAERHGNALPGYPQAWIVRFLKRPALVSGRDSWALTRLMGGMAPEIMHAQSTPDYWDSCHKWYVNLSEYFERPNPYIPGNKRWADIFNPGVLSFWASNADQGFYAVPIDQVEIGIFYNKTMIADCGIGPEEFPPRDWAHFIDIQRRIKQAGKVPFLMPAKTLVRMTWIYNVLTDMLYAEIYDRLNVVDGFQTSGTWGVNLQEKVRAYKKGIVSITDERYWEMWRIIKDWSRYWQQGYLGTEDTTGFQRGEAAMTLDSSSFCRQLVNDKKVKFQWSVFYIPKVTRQTSRFAIGAEPKGYGGPAHIQYSITRTTARRKQSVAACVDLLMWLTAPRHVGPLVAETQAFVPAVRVGDEYFPEHLKFMKPILARGIVRVYWIDAVVLHGMHEWWANMQYFLEGTYTKADVIRTMGAAVEPGMKELMTKFDGIWEWEFDDQGNCTWEIPEVRADGPQG